MRPSSSAAICIDASVARVLYAHSILLVAALAAGCVYRGGLAPGATAGQILKLEPGMNYGQVVALIGEPIAMSREWQDGREEPTTRVDDDAVVLTYSKPIIWARSHPMLWIHLVNGIVVDIYAKRGEFGAPGDVGLYGYSRGGRWGGGEEFQSLFRP